MNKKAKMNPAVPKKKIFITFTVTTDICLLYFVNFSDYFFYIAETVVRTKNNIYKMFVFRGVFNNQKQASAGFLSKPVFPPIISGISVKRLLVLEKIKWWKEPSGLKTS